MQELTINTNPSKFLDTKITENKNETKSFACHKAKKLTFHWASAVLINYKKNVIAEDLHRVNKISYKLKQKISTIKVKYVKVGYSNAIINSVTNNLLQNKDGFLIPPIYLKNKKYYLKNNFSKNFIFQVPYCDYTIV